MTYNEERVREIGGERLVRFYDLTLEKQRERWNAPDWRTQPWIEADFINAADTAYALQAVYGIPSG